MSKTNHQGYLITFEGIEGSGKTTLADRLYQQFQKIGKEAILLREPGGTEIGEQVRRIVLSTKNRGMTVVAELMLFQAARSQLYEEIVLPALSSGKIVIMDRSRDSSLAYQGIVRDLGRDLITELNDLTTRKTYPNLTILLDVPVKVGLERQFQNGKIHRFEMESEGFHQQIREAYLTLAKENDHNRWVVIDSKPEPDQVIVKVWQVVKGKLNF